MTSACDPRGKHRHRASRVAPRPRFFKVFLTSGRHFGETTGVWRGERRSDFNTDLPVFKSAVFTMATIESSAAPSHNRSQGLTFLLCLSVYVAFVYPSSRLSSDPERSDDGWRVDEFVSLDAVRGDLPLWIHTPTPPSIGSK